MARKKPMSPELWVARDPGPMEFLTWDVKPLMPKGERPATRYVRADIAGELLEALKAVLACNPEPGRVRFLSDAEMAHVCAAIAKAEGR